MIELNTDPAQLYSVPGIRLGSSAAQIKYTDRDDLVVLELADNAQTAAVFTQNAFCAAPVAVAKRHLGIAKPRYLVINAGNANAGTGLRGIEDALACCQAVADSTGCLREQVIPFSTGVIGEYLPISKMRNAIQDTVATLNIHGWQSAASAILTTDTCPKVASVRIEIDNQPITVTGMAKGSGMIRPDMATLLAYIATDADVEAEVLRHCLHNAISHSFNRITVDGDTSTNDACVLVASGKSQLATIDNIDSNAYYLLSRAISAVSEHLAQAVIRDAEGATKFITIDVSEGNNEQECETVAYTVAHSPLVKTALFASDPNWGRLIMAVGRAQVAGLDAQKISININDVCIVRNGERAQDYTEAQGQAVMQPNDINIHIALGRGNAKARVWTSDLSYDYIKINAEYRS